MNPEFSLRRFIQTLIGLALLSVAAFLMEHGDPRHEPHILVGGIGGLALMIHAAIGNLAAKPALVRRKSPADRLDRVLLHWDAENAFTLRDLLAGGVQVYGRTGAGKTSSSGQAIGRAIVRVPNSGGLIISSKSSDDLALWQRIFREEGREQDLLVFSPSSDLRMNVLDVLMQQDAETRSITKCLTIIAETLRSSDTDNRESADFWQREQERMIFNAVEIVKLATGRVSAPDLHRFISGAAMCTEQMLTDEWLAGFHNQCIKAAWYKPKSPMQKHDYDLAKEFWLGEFPKMADKTRSSILTGVMGLLHCFNVGQVRTLLSAETNITPDAMFNGKFLIVDMPQSEFGDVGAFVIGAWKYLTQKAILRRVANEDSNPVFIWADEAQQVITSFDAHFLAQCRSHHGAMIYLSQSVPGYVHAVGGDHAKAAVDALQASFSTKIFHALGDLETAEYASRLAGRSLQTFTGGSTTPPDSSFDELMGHQRYSGNYSQSYESTLQVDAFMHGLRTGGPANDFICDAYVIRSGEPFANGKHWLATCFSQKQSG